MNCLIVDDEVAARMDLRVMLERVGGVARVGEAADVAGAVHLIGQDRWDVLFLDVRLRGESGFDLLNAVDGDVPLLVLVTAHSDYALRGFEVGAVDYLLKPVNETRLSETLSRVRAARDAESERTPLKVGTSVRWVAWREVNSIEADGDYSHVHLRDGSRVMVLRSLREWMDSSPGGCFLRVHRKRLVRRGAVRAVESAGRGKWRIELEDGSGHSVGPDYWPTLKAALRSS